MACIKAGWALTGDLGVNNIKFSTGWYEKDVISPQVTVTEVSDRDIPFELGYGTIRVDAVYQADVWMKVIKATGKGPGIARGYLWAMREEAKRILRSNLTGLTDLKYVELDLTGRRLDEPERQLLRFSKLVGVIYEI